MSTHNPVNVHEIESPPISGMADIILALEHLNNRITESDKFNDGCFEKQGDMLVKHALKIIFMSAKIKELEERVQKLGFGDDISVIDHVSDDDY